MSNVQSRKRYRDWRKKMNIRIAEFRRQVNNGKRSFADIKFSMTFPKSRKFMPSPKP